MRPAYTCGYRVPALYVCERPVEKGIPLEFFLPCPPPYVDMQAIGLTAVGMRIIQRVDFQGSPTDVYDLWDYVSSQDNPWPADFLEQTRALGTSRRLPVSLTQSEDFKKLRAHPWDPALNSRHIYVHARAIIDDPVPFFEERTSLKNCPAGITEHDENQMPWQFCAALWWESVGQLPGKNGAVRRHKVYLPRDWDKKDKSGNTKYPAPSLAYLADHMPAGAAPTFLTGVIMSIPLMRMEIPRDESGDNVHDRLAQLLEQGGWQYDFEITEE